MSRSWVAVPEQSDFPLENLPFGVFARDGDRPRIGIAIGVRILDLAALAGEGLFDATLPDAQGLLGAASLDPLLQAGTGALRAVRTRAAELLAAQNDEITGRLGFADEVLVAQDEVEMALPFSVADYVDFYSSIEHASNLGSILRPGGEPLLPNYRWIPIGYHGRSSTVVVDGTPVRRPLGQTKTPNDEIPRVGPSRQLDFELEIGTVLAGETALGEAVPVDAAEQLVAGLVLLNDWSARDVQGWEYQPLGPFLAKSFATSISPWLVTADALAPYRIPQRAQDPPPLPYLRATNPSAYDIHLSVSLQTRAMRERGEAPVEIARTNFGGMYWSIAQQIAHLTSNGTRVRPGDLYGSGTISGDRPGTYGSLIELTRRGAEPLSLPDGETRGFLEDGDTVELRGWCGGDGRPRIGFGAVRGEVLASR